MSVYKSFAVVGGGSIGLPIVDALATHADVSIVLLSRPGSSTKAVPSGVQVIQVDFGNVAAVAAVLKEHQVDVVLSTVAPRLDAIAGQQSLVDAAKLAGVKLFVPSEYGFPAEGRTDGVFGAKNQIVGEKTP